jgi:hypothetical protein
LESRVDIILDKVRIRFLLILGTIHLVIAFSTPEEKITMHLSWLKGCFYDYVINNGYRSGYVEYKH